MEYAVAARGQQAITLLLMTAMCLGAAYVLSGAEVGFTALVVAGLSIGIIAFLRTEVALYLLIIAMLLSPEIGIGGLSGERASKGITLRFEDYLLVIVGLAWLFKSAVYKELNLLAHTAMNKPMFYYAAVCVFSTLIGIQTGDVQPLTGSLFVLKY